jgi:peptidoglycan hydrolase CwlO-like protein
MENSVYANTRKKLAERRSSLIKSVRFSYQDEQMKAHIDVIVRVQGVIDVVDRVSKEEAASP